MNRCIVLAAGLLMGMVLTPIQAQETVLAELYGQGVHAYYSGDYRMAHQFLTSAIDQGSRDPRAYYFRGLTYASLGRPTEADADFRTGAQLETQKADRIYPVAESLQRVQGRMRLQLERHRQIGPTSSLSRFETGGIGSPA
jgi:Flp pilus assembly protein TadD